jgi:hypothetical protein
MQLTAPGRATAALRGFVRDTLGCTCPESVFESVERGSLSGESGAAVTRLVIGGRLLIYVVPEEPEAARVAALADAGRRDRDGHALNRFRLVVARPAEVDSGNALVLDAAFRDAVDGDPKAHLHCVPAEALADALSE